ncbi:MAG: hypothetical protein AB7L94_25815, partial [Kofleriaceae bacterium]
ADRSAPLPAFDAVPSPETWGPARRPRWVVPALVGVPLVAVLAFVIVSRLGASDPATPPPAASIDDEPPPAKVETKAGESEPATPAPTPIDKTVVPERPAAKAQATKEPSKKDPPRKNPPKKDVPRKDPAKKVPPRKDPSAKDPPAKKDPPRGFTIPDGDGLATPTKS